MTKQAEAERERRAKVISADGEYQAAAKLSQAAEVLGELFRSLTNTTGVTESGGR